MFLAINLNKYCHFGKLNTPHSQMPLLGISKIVNDSRLSAARHAKQDKGRPETCGNDNMKNNHPCLQLFCRDVSFFN